MDGAAFFSYGAGQGKNKDLPGGAGAGQNSTNMVVHCSAG